MGRRALRPVETNAFAQIGERSGEFPHVDFGTARERSQTNRTVQVIEVGDASGELVRSAHVDEFRAQLVGLPDRCVGQQFFRSRHQALHAVLKACDQFARGNGAGSDPDEIGHLAAKRTGHMAEKVDANIFRHRSRFKLCPQFTRAEEPVRHDERRGHVSQADTFFFRQFERMHEAHAINEAVGQCSGDDFTP